MVILEGSAFRTESPTYHAFCRALHEHRLYLKLFSSNIALPTLANR